MYEENQFLNFKPKRFYRHFCQKMVRKNEHIHFLYIAQKKKNFIIF